MTNRAHTLVVGACAAALLGSSALGGGTDADAVRQVAIDYATGFYEMDPDKVQSTCHPLLAKRSVSGEFWGQPHEWLRPITYEEMRPLALRFNKLPDHGWDPETARKDVVIYEIDEHVASAKLTGTIWFDYFHMVKVNGEWKVINVLWQSLTPDGETPEGSPAEADAITAVCRQFVDGFYHSKPELVRETLHSGLSKMTVNTHRSGQEYLRPIAYEELIENSKVWNSGWLDPSEGRFEVEIFEFTNNSASVKLVGEVWFDYLHLAKIEGDWVIVNCVWDMLPDHRKDAS